MKALLDTHVLLWWHCDREMLSRDQWKVIANADAETPLQVSDISLWEMATLHSLGRIRLAIPLREWLEKAVAPPLVRRHGVSPAVASELDSLPASFHRDRPDNWSDASDAGPQNLCSKACRHAGLTSNRPGRPRPCGGQLEGMIDAARNNRRHREIPDATSGTARFPASFLKEGNGAAKSDVSG